MSVSGNVTISAETKSLSACSSTAIPTAVGPVALTATRRRLRDGFHDT